MFIWESSNNTYPVRALDMVHNDDYETTSRRPNIKEEIYQTSKEVCFTFAQNQWTEMTSFWNLSQQTQHFLDISIQTIWDTHYQM